MPVYLRNQITLPTPTISDIPDDQNDDFLQDPDQRWDQLPQPFRFLNKIVFNVIDDAWEIANSREVHRIIDASKIRPPQFKCWTKLQVTCYSFWIKYSENHNFECLPMFHENQRERSLFTAGGLKSENRVHSKIAPPRNWRATFLPPCALKFCPPPHLQTLIIL